MVFCRTSYRSRWVLKCKYSCSTCSLKKSGIRDNKLLSENCSVYLTLNLFQYSIVAFLFYCHRVHICRFVYLLYVGICVHLMNASYLSHHFVLNISSETEKNQSQIPCLVCTNLANKADSYFDLHSVFRMVYQLIYHSSLLGFSQWLSARNAAYIVWVPERSWSVEFRPRFSDSSYGGYPLPKSHLVWKWRAAFNSRSLDWWCVWWRDMWATRAAPTAGGALMEDGWTDERHPSLINPSLVSCLVCFSQPPCDMYSPRACACLASRSSCPHTL